MMRSLASTQHQQYFSYEQARRRRLADALIILFPEIMNHAELIASVALILVANFAVIVQVLQIFVRYADVIVNACGALIVLADVVEAGLSGCEAVWELWQEMTGIFRLSFIYC